MKGKNGAGTAILEKAGFNAIASAANTTVMAIDLVPFNGHYFFECFAI